MLLADGTTEWRSWVGPSSEREVVRQAFSSWKDLEIGLRKIETCIIDGDRGCCGRRCFGCRLVGKSHSPSGAGRCPKRALCASAGIRLLRPERSRDLKQLSFCLAKYSCFTDMSSLCITVRSMGPLHDSHNHRSLTTVHPLLLAENNSNTILKKRRLLSSKRATIIFSELWYFPRVPRRIG